MKRILTIISIILVITIGIVLSVRSDSNNNSFGIDEACYGLYISAINAPDFDIQKVRADSLIALAERKDDKKAKVLGLLALGDCYGAAKDEEKINECSKEARRISYEIRFEEGFVKAYRLLTRYYSAMEDYEQAQIIAEKLLQESKNLNFKYGIWLAYYTFGHCGRNMNFREQEKDNFRRAIELYPMIPPLIEPENISDAYIELARINPSLEERSKLLSSGLKVVNNHRDSLRLLRALSEITFDEGDTSRFIDYYKVYANDPQREEVLSTTEFMISNALYYLMIKEPDSAYHVFDEIKASRYYYNYLSFVAGHDHDWNRAIKYHLKYDSVLRVEEEKKIEKGRSELSQEWGNDQLIQKMEEEKAAVLEAQNLEKQAAINLIKAEAKRQESESQRQRLLLEEQSNEANNALLILETQQHEAEAQQAQNLSRQAELEASVAAQEAKAKRNHIELITFIALIIVGLLLLGVLFGWLHLRRKNMKHVKQMNEELAEARRQAERASTIKDNFIKNMSVEIRTPLNSVLGITQVLTAPGIEFTDEEKEEYGNQINENVNMLTMIIDDILNVSDIQTGNFGLTLSQCNVKQLCEMAIQQCRQYLHPGVRLLFINHLPEGFEAMLDSRRVQQVFQNFLSNSCKYTTEGDIVMEAMLDHEPNMLTFVFTDKGNAISAEEREGFIERQQKHMYEQDGIDKHSMFRMCLVVAEKMGGKVWLDNSYRDGTRLEFDIPLNQEPSTTSSSDTVK